MHSYKITISGYEGTNEISLLHKERFNDDELEVFFQKAVKNMLDSKNNKYSSCFCLSFYPRHIEQELCNLGFVKPTYTASISCWGDQDSRKSCEIYDDDCVNTRLAKFLNDNGYKNDET